MRMLVFLLSVYVLLVACGGGQEPEDVQSSEEGILPVCTLTVIDSIGVELGDSAYVFGSIEGIGYTPSGNIARAFRCRASDSLRVKSPSASSAN